MAKSYYLPTTDDGKDVWLQNFSAKLPLYSGGLGLVAADLTGVAADAAFFHFALQAVAQVSTYAQQWTTYKNAARSGALLGAAPVVPVLTPAPVVAAGIFIRMAALAARIKKAPGYSEAIGQALNIIGAEQTLDTTAVKPVLTLVFTAGQVLVQWKKQGLDGIELHVDRGTGFTFLAVDTVPDYVDTQGIAAGQSALWKYKAIYRLADERVGQWSDVVSIAVGG